MFEKYSCATGSQANYNILNLKLNTELGASLNVIKTEDGEMYLALLNKKGKILDSKQIPLNIDFDLKSVELKYNEEDSFYLLFTKKNDDTIECSLKDLYDKIDKKLDEPSGTLQQDSVVVKKLDNTVEYKKVNDFKSKVESGVLKIF